MKLVVILSLVNVEYHVSGTPFTPRPSIGRQEIVAYPTITRVFSVLKPISQDVGDEIILSCGGSGLFDKNFVSKSTTPKA
ncbi:hypothetical protein MCOR18_004477, partial [Pyricularia oryzae]